MNCWRGRGRAAAAAEDRCSRPDCVFCSIVANGGETGRPLLHEDAHCVAFYDRSPAAALHILVVPRLHVANCAQLRGGPDEALAAHLLSVGRRLLEKHGAFGAETQLGYHQAPFTSVNHLHLHCFSLPWKPWKALKYPAAPAGADWCLPWYLSAEQLAQVRCRCGSSKTA